MDFGITPHLGVGSLQFGMHRAAIRALFANTPDQFYRGEVEDTDYYEAVGLFVLYDAAERCVALEMTRPARVLLEERELLELSKKEAVALFQTDAALEQDESGYTCYQYGVGAYYESPKKAETVIAFCKGYYQQ